MFKVIIAGSRDFNDYELLKKLVSHTLVNQQDVEIVSGGARGADALGERYAKEHGLSLKRFPADWEHGKSAGYIRNAEMAKYGDALIAFWDLKSKGTKHMITNAKLKGLKIKVYDLTGQVVGYEVFIK